ncbi:MAG: DUF1549 and DUF1553 domain-containing protein [Isosphaeraceae bacterium]|nr:DUF1549 and DUF1553 domain-containing protein [Isosphaeraceae bacterium]
MRWSPILAVVLVMMGSEVRGQTPAALSVIPAPIVLSGPAAGQQIAVTLSYTDGSVRDVTSIARLAVGSEGVARVSERGVVRPLRDGATRLHVEASGYAVDVPIQVQRASSVRPVSYRLDVSAVLSKAGCNMGACHGNLNGKGGFKLSLRGDDPRLDWVSLTHDTFARRTDPGAPARSLVLLKPTGQVPHEGGIRFNASSPEAAVLKEWVAQGAHDDEASAPRLKRLSVFPVERIAAPGALAQQLVITAEFEDGTLRDVTRQASYDVSDPTIAGVTSDGRVEARRACETTVAVRYLAGRAISRLAFLRDRPGFVWHDVPECNVIDTHVFAKLKAFRVAPSGLASDPVFLRRAYLDAIGRLPAPGEVRAFLADREPGKRDRVIDRLLTRPEFADFWALKWADLLRNEEKTMGQKGVWVFQRWLRDQVARDLPLDVFARQLVSATGSTWSNPPASFYRTNRDPETCAETIGQVFLGVRLQCARCHNHPFDVWTQDDYYGLAAFFANVQRKEINNIRRDEFDKFEINGDEAIYVSGRPQTIQPRSGVMMDPKPPRAPRPELGDDPDALDDLALWLTRDNPQFTRNIANRVWYHLTGRGIVDPVDDFRDSNPPSNPALLDALAGELVRNGLRLRPLVALIMKSRTYQLDAVPNETNAGDEVNFSHAIVRLLPAEVLLDAISDALDEPGQFRRAPRDSRAVQLPGVTAEGDFLKVFGKPDRLLSCECERSDSTSLAQAFQLINGEAIREKLVADNNRLGALLKVKASEESIVDELALAILGHALDDEGKAGVLRHVAGAGDRRKAWEDIAWAMLNSKEFLLRH